MVIGANSISAEIPNWGYGEERKFIQCKTAQLWYSRAVKTAWLWSCHRANWLLKLESSKLYSSALLLSGSALYCSGLYCSAVPCSGETSLVFHQRWKRRQSQGDKVFSLWWKGKVYSQSQREAGLYIQKSPHLLPDWCILMQMRILNLCNSDWMKKASATFVEVKFQELLYKSYLRWQKHSRQALQCRPLPERWFVW